MDIWDYFSQKEREFTDVGAYPDRELAGMMRAECGSEHRGIIRGNLGLTEGAFVGVYERVVIEVGGDPRAAYSYTLVIDGIHVHRWDNDPQNHPEAPIHEHTGSDESRSENTDPITLRAVLERAWEEVSLQAEAPLDP